MNKITLPILLLIIGYAYSAFSLDEEYLEPYEEFNWLDEDDFTITVPFKSATDMPSTCCLYNGTRFCAGACSTDSNAFTVSCKFTGASCQADADNPATKFYYSLYCSSSNCASESTASSLGTSDNVYVTVAVLSGSYIKYSIVLLLSLLAF